MISLVKRFLKKLFSKKQYIEIPKFKRKKVYLGYLFQTNSKLHDIINTFSDLIEWSQHKTSFSDVIFIGERISFNYNLIVHYKEYIINQYVNIYSNGSSYVVEIISYQNISHSILQEVNNLIYSFFVNRSIYLNPYNTSKKARLTHVNLDTNITINLSFTLPKLFGFRYKLFNKCLLQSTDKFNDYSEILQFLLKYVMILIKEAIIVKSIDKFKLIPSILYFTNVILLNFYKIINENDFVKINKFNEYLVEIFQKKMTQINSYLSDLLETFTKSEELTDFELDSIPYIKISLIYIIKMF